jgi:hypothetical protein
MSILKHIEATAARRADRDVWQEVCRGGLVALMLGTAGCAASPWGFPVPTMIGDEQGVAMTGIIKASTEEDVRRRLAEKMKCPDRLHVASLTTERADNALGTKMLLYKAVMRCDDTQAAPSSRRQQVK